MAALTLSTAAANAVAVAARIQETGSMFCVVPAAAQSRCVWTLGIHVDAA